MEVTEAMLRKVLSEFICPAVTYRLFTATCGPWSFM